MKFRLLILVFLVFGIGYNVIAQQINVQIFTKDALSTVPLDSVVINIYNTDNRSLEYNTVTDSTGIIFFVLLREQKYFIEAIKKDYVKRILTVRSEAEGEGDTLQVLLEMVSLDSGNKTNNQRVLVRDVSGQMDKPELPKNSLTTENDIIISNFVNRNDTKDFTGYRIVIHFSRFPISKDHILYYTHDEVVEFETKSKNYLYMVETYESLQEAKEGHFENYKEEYPLSYIIGFDKGIRIK